MINLSGRLKCIADRIPKGSSVADIGTDHGHLPLFLLENQIATRVIATDISNGSLNKGRYNAEEYGYLIKPEFRLGDGLEVLEPGEVDVVIMAGIGGQNIAEILDWDMYKSGSYSLYILQPRNNAGKLRYFLSANGFEIIEEIIVPEGNRFSEIILMKPGSEVGLNITARKLKYMPYDYTEYDYPESLIGYNNKFIVDYIEKRLIEENSIYDHIVETEAGTTAEGERRSNAMAYRIKRIKRLEDLKSRLKG